VRIDCAHRRGYEELDRGGEILVERRPGPRPELSIVLETELRDPRGLYHRSSYLRTWGNHRVHRRGAMVALVVGLALHGSAAEPRGAYDERDVANRFDKGICDSARANPTKTPRTRGAPRTGIREPTVSR